MRLAVSIAAWSHDPDATLPPEHAMLPSALQALGFSVMHTPLGELPAGLSAALAGIEAHDTLIVQVSGILGDDGSIELPDADPMPLSVVADVLAARPRARALVIVEAAYRGEEDAFRAVEFVEAVSDALSSNGGSHATVIAVHPVRADVAKLAFTRLVLEAVRDVVNGDGAALLDDAYARARERQMSGIAASGFAFFRGETPFYILEAPAAQAAASVPTDAPTPSVPGPSAPTPSVPTPAITEPAVASSSRRAPLPVPPERESTRTFNLADAISSRRILSPPPPAEPSSPVTAPFPLLAAPVVAPVAPAPITSPSALDASAARAPSPVPSEPAVKSAPEPSTMRTGSLPIWVDTSEVEGPEALAQLDARIAAATAVEDYGLAVQLSRRRLSSLPTVDARVDELFEIGRTLVAKLRDLPEAVVTLEEARAINPSRQDVIEALRRAYTRLERWTEALEVTLSLVKLTTDVEERAGLRVAAAALACQHLDDDDYALELLSLALDDDPGHEEALDEVARIRRSRGEFAVLARTLDVLVERLVAAGNAARAWDACQRLAAVRRDDLGDTAGAVEALALAKQLPLSELDHRAVLAEQFLALDDDEGALGELEAIVAEAPTHPRAHARIFSVHHRAGQNDRAYLSALVLEEMGHADATARQVLETYRSNWGLRARAGLDDRAWDILRSRGSDDVIEAVFRATVRAAIAAQLEDRTNRPALDPSRRQPETSTASIVRCFHWAARALGLPCPALYVLDEVAGGIAAVSADEPTTALGPDVLRGLSSKTLAFLAGRHLTYFRPEYQVLVHFPTVEAAAGLFFAAVELVAPGTFVPPNLALRVHSAKFRLARQMRPAELAALSAAVGRMEARDAKIDLIGWIRSVELTAGHAGLLLAGDLQPVLAQVRAEPRGLSGLSVEERAADLIAFCASRSLAELRAAYADTTPSSMRPPTTDSAVVRRDDPSLTGVGDAGSARMLG